MGKRRLIHTVSVTIFPQYVIPVPEWHPNPKFLCPLFCPHGRSASPRGQGEKTWLGTHQMPPQIFWSSEKFSLCFTLKSRKGALWNDSATMQPLDVALGILTAQIGGRKRRVYFLPISHLMPISQPQFMPNKISHKFKGILLWKGKWRCGNGT